MASEEKKWDSADREKKRRGGNHKKKKGRRKGLDADHFNEMTDASPPECTHMYIHPTTPHTHTHKHNAFSGTIQTPYFAITIAMMFHSKIHSPFTKTKLMVESESASFLCACHANNNWHPGGKKEKLIRPKLISAHQNNLGLLTWIVASFFSWCTLMMLNHRATATFLKHRLQRDSIFLCDSMMI